MNPDLDEVQAQIHEDYRSVTVSVRKINGEWFEPEIDDTGTSPWETLALLDAAATMQRDLLNGHYDEEYEEEDME